MKLASEPIAEFQMEVDEKGCSQRSRQGAVESPRGGAEAVESPRGGAEAAEPDEKRRNARRSKRPEGDALSMGLRGVIRRLQL